jgi:hypothetical protein
LQPCKPLYKIFRIGLWHYNREVCCTPFYCFITMITKKHPRFPSWRLHVSRKNTWAFRKKTVGNS